MPIELTLIPESSIRTYALSDSHDIAHVDLEGLFPKFPALDGTFAIFWLEQLQGRHIVGFSTEGSNLLAVISLPTPDLTPLSSRGVPFMRSGSTSVEPPADITPVSALATPTPSINVEGSHERLEHLTDNPPTVMTCTDVSVFRKSQYCPWLISVFIP